jgi:uroporphyrin-III C-methyltransferase / precorrin-2 dehydrogenase / sirohydrochlorin ferrochelatase
MKIVSRQPSEARPARIGTLSVLPVFLDLKDKRAVVAGGSEAAAWKAELLLAAGGRIELYAPELSGEMSRVLVREPSITHHARKWDDACLAGAAVALADAEDDREAAAFERAARAAGVPCNVIDRPAFCHFQFGSIVNRSPVVVGISTSGAAPILGQAIRRRIETLLPPSLAEWARLASNFRSRVTNRLAPGAERRGFWTAFVDHAFGPAPEVGAEHMLSQAMDEVSASCGRGHVTFVGAGPGDAELLTLKAVRALQAADVILFDDLVSDEVLELARREARRILVGKRAGRPSCQQDEINGLMVKLAGAGRHVVRLKSGDPMIFGRAGEEIAELERHRIAYSVVPGITAGVALASCLGTSLTHRDHARSVRFVTGHSKDGGLPRDVDWAGVADPTATTIFYMGGRNARQISDKLLSCGMPPDMPVIVACDLGRAAQTLVGTNLAGLPETIEKLSLQQAILIGVGRVFGRGLSATNAAKPGEGLPSNARGAAAAAAASG